MVLGVRNLSVGLEGIEPPPQYYVMGHCGDLYKIQFP